MNKNFANTLKKLRKEKGLSQVQVGRQLFVNHSTIARWENGSRMPDAAMINRLSKVLDVDISVLLSAAAEGDDSPNIIIVDDSKAILSDSLQVLERVVPNATIAGFIWPQEAIEYTKTNRVSLAFLDIELGSASGLDLCEKLIEINPYINIVYLTAYPDYSLDAWNTGACGFLLKPLTPESILKQLTKLRYPLGIEGLNEAQS